jgi:radical SAM superfamily enzyme YgiQ (UPF0313 family)
MRRKVLMVYPEIPMTFWSLKHAIRLAGYKSVIPPLGLLTVASMLPADYEVRLIDMAVTRLTPKDIAWADIVFVSAMQIQRHSFEKVVALCNECGVPVAAGGPYASASFKEISGVDYFILNEAELTLPRFLHDYELGRPRNIYQDLEKPDITRTPPPRLDLIDVSRYSSMALQFSRGCPHNCEFCDIIRMFGRVPRTKTPGQFIAEMELVYRTGYRGSLFIVDDNFIGNKSKVKALLREIIAWQKERGYPFYLYTEASLDLAQDDELMDLMLEAGLGDVFLGIESPDPDTLADIQKKQNIRHDMHESIKKMHGKGLEIMGGFIVGFDTDTESIFERQIDFIQKAGIPKAMVGLLSAIPNTPLYERLDRENRIMGVPTGDNLALDLNFVPKMPAHKLINGYRHIIDMIYTPKNYFKRCMIFIENLPESHKIWEVRKQSRGKDFYKTGDHQVIRQMKAAVILILKMTFSSYGHEFIRFFIKSLRYNRKYFVCTMNLLTHGYHYFKMREMILRVPPAA